MSTMIDTQTVTEDQLITRAGEMVLEAYDTQALSPAQKKQLAGMLAVFFAQITQE